LACAYQPDYSAKFVDHHGALPVQIGALVDLSELKIESESFEYFKIHGDLVEVSITKSVQN
jgi:hypothetical protein